MATATLTVGERITLKSPVHKELDGKQATVIKVTPLNITVEVDGTEHTITGKVQEPQAPQELDVLTERERQQEELAEVMERNTGFAETVRYLQGLADVGNTQGGQTKQVTLPYVGTKQDLETLPHLPLQQSQHTVLLTRRDIEQILGYSINIVKEG